LQGGPLSGVTYSWTGAGLTGATNQATAAITAPGTYTLVTTSTVNGCTNTAVVTPTANLTPPNASVNPDVTINCVTPTATVSGSSSTPGVTYAWTGPTIGNPAGSTPTSSTSVVNAAGNYTLTVTNPVNGCTATAVQAVTSNVTIPTITVGSSQTVTCLSPSAVLTGSSSASPVNYSWTGPAVGNPAGSTPTNSTTTINAGGTYTLVVTNPLNSCTNTAVVSITQNTTPPSITATNTSTLTCTTLTANVSGTGGGTYAWLGPGITSGATSSNATVNQPGTYNLTVTAANGCTATASTSITQNTTAPTATLTPSSLTTTCASPTASLLVTSSADPNSIYTWTAPISGSLNNINSNNPVASGSGIFTVAVTNTINGCVSAIQTVTITSDVNTPVLNAISSNSIICSGEPTTLSVTGADSYTWSSGAGSVNTSTAIVSPTVTTTYSVIGTNTLTGCSNVTNITITANETPTIGVSSNVNAICLGNNSIINLTGASSYTITNPLLVVTNSIVVTPTIQTTYTVVGSISNCVSASQTITIDVNSLPTLNATASNSTICSNQTTTLSITGADTYTWSTLETATTITVSPSTTTTYSVSGTNTLTGCSNITNVTVNVTPTPTVNVSASAITICEGNTTTLTLTGATNYTVTNPSQTTTGTIVLTPTAQTTYTIVGESSNCASTTQTITIDVNALPILATSNATTCAGSPVTLSATGADTYNWQPTGATTNTTSVLPTTNTTYTVTGTNTVTGCTSTITTADITVNQLPNITASANPNTTCTNGTVNLNAATTGTTAITNYTWTLGNGVDNTNQNQGSITFPASGLTTGTYTYTVVATDANGCVSLQATTTLDIIDTPNANFDLSDLSICQNENGTISINTPQTGVTYDWNINGQAVTNTNPLTVPSSITSAAGTYTVNVIAGIGTCTNTAANTLTVNALPTVALVNSITSACVNTSAQLDVAGPNSTYTYNWTNGSNTATGPNLNVNPLTQATAGSYTLTATDQNGCVNRTIGAIDAQECITEVPEIFTPNGDGKNDGFVIKNIENFPDNKLKIFNRWGNLVYQKDGYLNEFEGFANTGDQVGKSKLPSGTYYVILEYGDEKTETYNGILVLQY
jgi:gliding motility-associated-like protein